MNDPALAKNLTAVTANFESLSSKLNKGEGTMGQLMNNDALYKRLDARDDQPRAADGQAESGAGDRWDS